MPKGCQLACLFSLFFSLSLVRAQVPHAFNWKFGGNFVSTSLSECASYPIIVQTDTSTNLTGVPPFYLTAFPSGGIPTSSLVGSNPSSLSWTVNQPSGATLLLTITDSVGNTGGFSPTIFSVISGSSSSCLPSAPSTNITLVSNLTSSIETCQPWGLRVYGGTPPYNISIGQPNSPTITNVSLGAGNDVFTYINRADPNSHLLAAVIDANGQVGTTTALLNTTGPAVTNNSCVGLVSIAGNHTNVDQNPKPPAKSNTAAIAAGVAIPIVVLALGGALAFWYWRRKKLERERAPQPAILPDAWYRADPSSTRPGSSLGGDAASGTYPPLGGKAAMAMAYAHSREQSATMVPLMAIDGHGHGSGHVRNDSNASIDGRMVMTGSGSRPGSAGGQGGVGADATSDSSSGPPTTPGASASGSGKGRRGASSRFTPSPLHAQQQQQQQLPASGSRLPPGLPAEWSVEPGIVIQHRDAGTPVVHEIPPPYFDRTPQPDPLTSGSDPSTNVGNGNGAPSGSFVVDAGNYTAYVPSPASSLRGLPHQAPPGAMMMPPAGLTHAHSQSSLRQSIVEDDAAEEQQPPPLPEKDRTLF